MLQRGAVAIAILALAACGGDGRTLREPIFDPPTRVEVTVPPATEPAVGALTTPDTVVVITEAPGEVDEAAEATNQSPDDGRVIEFGRLYSPANATAEVLGRGAIAGDPVTVDGEPADVLMFEPSADGTFVVQVWIEDEGAHTLCVADTCGRVYTLAPDAESPEEVVAKIEAALVLAADLIDYETEFPDWTVEIGGALAGTGGTADIETQTVTIYRNRGREVDDFVRTVLHEFGHVADFERLDDAERAQYLVLRGLDPKQEWRADRNHRIDDWAKQPSEDFAETVAMLWSDGRWTPRTFDPELVPTDDLLAAVAAMVESPAG